MVSSQRRIAALRWFLIFLVVLVHTIQGAFLQSGYDSFRDAAVCHEGFYGLFANVFYRNLGLVGGLALMFIFSGYLTVLQGVPDYATLIRRKCRTLLMPLVLWTAVGMAGYVLMRPFFGHIATAEFIFSGDPKLWMTRLLVEGQMFMYQMWFVRDLITLNLCLPIILFLVRRYPIHYFCVLAALAERYDLIADTEGYRVWLAKEK